MTDHYRTAREALDLHRDAVARLDAEHAKGEHQRNPKRVAELYSARDTAMQLAKVHAQLATAQAIQDLAMLADLQAPRLGGSLGGKIAALVREHDLQCGAQPDDRSGQFGENALNVDGAGVCSATEGLGSQADAPDGFKGTGVVGHAPEASR